MWEQAFRNEEIVNAPADVVLAGVAPVRPPGIALGVGMEAAESVDESSLEQIINSLPFFGGEASVVGVLFGAGEVDFGMGGVKIAADYDRFGLFKSFEILEQGGVPDVLAHAEAGKVGLTIWYIDIDEEKIGEFGGLEAAFD